jgi:uncharacterized protein (TIRG00374 family)
MRKALVFFLLLLVGIAVFAYVIYQTGISNITDALVRVTVLQMILFFSVSLLNFAFLTFRWWIVLISHGHSVSFWFLFFSRMVGYSVSYLTPVAQVGGEPFRIYLLNERKGVSLKESASSVIIDKIFEIASLLFFLGCGVFIILLRGFLSPKTEVLLVLLLVVSVFLLFHFFVRIVNGAGYFSSLFRFFRLSKIRRIAHLEEKIVHTEHFISHFFKNSKFFVLPVCIGISAVCMSITVLEHYMLAQFLGISMSFLTLFLIATLPTIAYILPVPGGFGMLEGGYSSVFMLLGFQPAAAIAMVLLIRMRDLLFVLIGLLSASHHGFWLLIKSRSAKKVFHMLR